MAVLKNIDGNELMVDCLCGCDTGIRLRVDKNDFDMYCFMTYTNGAFYKEQGETIFGVLGKKLKKIWAIIRNKDYYYSEFVMNKSEFDMFREYLNNVGKEE